MQPARRDGLRVMRRNFPSLLILPLVVAVAVGVPLVWAFPSGLTFWRSVGIVLGWLGGGLLLASLLLMLREPRLAASFGGLERMYRWHHRLGVCAYVAFLAHPLALALDGWQERPALAWSVLAPAQESWPVWCGWAALLVMMLGLAVALTPPQNLRYALWRGLHALLALSVVLGGLHLLLLGVDTPLLILPVLAVVLMLWRALRADVGLAARPYRVAQVAVLGSDVVEATLQPVTSQAAAIHEDKVLQPGQFVLAAFLDGPGFSGCGEYHPFTVSGSGPDGSIAIGIKALGDCTRHLQGLQPEVAVRVQGPFGSFLPARLERPGLWLAGGIGITPFIAALRSQTLRQPVHLIYLHRDDDDAAYADVLNALWPDQPALTLDIQASGATLPDLRVILPESSRLAACVCYLCGPPGLVDAARGVLHERGVAKRDIHFERFDFR